MSFPDKPESVKKRRRLNNDGADGTTRTLLDYFTPIPNKKKSPRRIVVDNNWFWGRLPTEVLFKSVFKFLTVQDITNLGRSCHQLTTLVNAYRGPLPHIVREELMPYKINYVNLRSSVDTALADNYYEVSRARVIRFLLKTARHRVIQVEIKLGNLVWTEVANHLVLLANPEHKKPWVEVKIYRQVKNLGSGSYERVQLFENVVSYHDEEGSLCYYLEGYDRSPEDQYFEQRNLNNSKDNPQRSSPQQPRPVSVAMEANQRACVQYILKCCQRIAKSPTEFNLPNLDYLLDQAVPPSLRHFLLYHIDTAQAKIPPKKQAMWKHRKAPSVFIRRRFFSSGAGGAAASHTATTTGSRRQHKRDQHGQLTREYLIHEIPWYRDWYPQETILWEGNLLQSLPPQLIATLILPFLEGDSVTLYALEKVCPKIVRGSWRCQLNSILS